uniref:Uncharacterized protein n=1 Tax=Anguilla anguilla TaxID=7936 RepID=A0A0E9U7B6_ANGAN
MRVGVSANNVKNIIIWGTTPPPSTLMSTTPRSTSRAKRWLPLML